MNILQEDNQEIIERAKQLFWTQSESWTGHRWDWDKASEEVKAKFIKHAENDTRPPLPQEL